MGEPSGAPLRLKPGIQAGGISRSESAGSGGQINSNSESVGRAKRRGHQQFLARNAEAEVGFSPRRWLSPPGHPGPYRQPRGGPQQGSLNALLPPTSHQRYGPPRSSPGAQGLKTGETQKPHVPQTIWGIISGGNSVKTGAARQESLLNHHARRWLEPLALLHATESNASD
jgi:hypothetical protein